ncbi:flagellar export protein FliJ [Thiolapillus sp.]
MSRNKPLLTVAKIATDRERNAAREMSHSQTELDIHMARLNELNDYRQQYLQQFQAASKKGLGVVQLQEYQIFLGRLDEAIDQQQKLLEASRISHEERQQLWLSLRGKVKALDKVIHQRQQQQLADQRRREQNESDDQSCSLAHWRML